MIEGYNDWVIWKEWNEIKRTDLSKRKFRKELCKDSNASKSFLGNRPEFSQKFSVLFDMNSEDVFIFW